MGSEQPAESGQAPKSWGALIAGLAGLTGLSIVLLPLVALYLSRDALRAAEDEPGPYATSVAKASWVLGWVGLLIGIAGLAWVLVR